MKVKRVLLSVVLILVVALLLCNTNTYATTGLWKLGAEQKREGITTKNGENGVAEYENTRYSFQMNNKSVLKIVDKTTGTADFRNAIYCVKAGQGFGSAEFDPDNPITDVTYNTYFDMVTEMANVNSILSLTPANYNSLMWLLDNIYLPKQSSDDLTLRYGTKVDLLYEAFKDEIRDPNSDFYHYTINDFHLTDDDIEVVQQWAIWYFTNSGDNTYHVGTLPQMQVSQVGGNAAHTPLNDEGPEVEIGKDTIKEGYIRQLEAEVLYKYLITEHADYTQSVASEVKLNKNLQPTAKKVGTSYVVGPFEITSAGNPKSLVGTVVYKNNNSLIEGTQYTISDANGNTIPRIGTLAEAVGNGQFYIKVSNAIIQSNDIEDLTLKIDYIKDDTTKTFWTVDGSTVDQPVVVVKRETEDLSDNIKVHIPEFDLALRKHIVSVTRDGKTVTIQKLNERIPDIYITNLKTNTNDKTDTTAIYEHRKDPVPVQTGDMVEYAITIYNEGEVAGRATKIVDHLPEGLEFRSSNSTNYTFEVSADKRTITITPKSGYVRNLAAYNGTTLDSEEIRLICEVTKKEDKSIDGDTILTNIAQITESCDINNEKMQDIGDDRDSEPNNAILPTDANLPYYKGNESNKPDLTDNTYFYKGQQDDDDFEKLIVHTPGFDLALRKFITHINGVEIEVSREPIVDTTPLKNESGTTAIYTHPKNPLTINIGDRITYKIRIYNEGEIDGKATVIEDYLPEELEMVPVEESGINAKYGWISSGRIITTTYLKDDIIKAYNGGDTLDYKDVEIECRLKETENLGKVLTNIAQINGASRDDDIDSTPSNVEKPSDKNLPNYKKNQEDDDDFEKVIIYQPEYDLALRKFIVEVDGKEPKISRVPVVDVTPLVNGTSTTAIYTHTKEPLVVKNGNIVVYTIRVYNEGKYDGYAELVKDNIPEGLEFVIDNEINIEYRWRLSDDEKSVSTDYLSKARDTKNVIKAFDSEKMETLDYKDVKIAFKVVEPNTSMRILTNIAEIKDDDGKDIDSTPDNDEPDEDDIDVEHVKLRYFDLALRKFITKVESKTGENLPIETDTTKDVSREPTVEIKEDGTIKYVHPKDPVIVANTDIVIYTLRVYNEGTIDGFAEEIKDDVPVGLELVPEHEINVKYGWVMYDEDGNVTNDVTKAKTIRTTYLSEEKDTENIIKAFDRETMATPDYKDVQVAFKVVEKDIDEGRIVINTAEISEDSDDDEDSTPDNDEPDEDDIDKEYVKVKYFDLALLKWVSKVSITRNGQTTVTDTGYNGLENPEPLVKTEIKTSEIKSIIIKYEYGIKITNEGEIAGYAKEVADYIPKGLEFIPEDNPLWTLERDGKIVTTQLEDTLLQPGESAIIHVVFKWINNENNFGEKENIAEISKDYNEKDTPDKDSTPNNEKPEEDDQDNAFVIISPKTGTEKVIFIVLPTIILAIIVVGIILIKKYVL